MSFVDLLLLAVLTNMPRGGGGGGGALSSMAPSSGLPGLSSIPSVGAPVNLGPPPVIQNVPPPSPPSPSPGLFAPGYLVPQVLPGLGTPPGVLQVPPGLLVPPVVAPPPGYNPNPVVPPPGTQGPSGTFVAAGPPLWTTGTNYAALQAQFPAPQYSITNSGNMVGGQILWAVYKNF